MRALIVSSGWQVDSFLEDHIASVESQTFTDLVHGVYIDEASKDFSYLNSDKRFVISAQNKGCTLNSQHEILFLADTDPEVCIFWLDADDRFHDPEVVSYIMDLYDSDPDLLLTYGQLVPDPYDSRCPRAMPYPAACHQKRDYRRASKWGHQFNHLRTMRVKLWEAIPADYTLTEDKHYMTVAGDAAEMIAGLEMAGPDRVKFVDRPNVLYTTDNQLSDWRRDPRLINRTHAWIERMPKLPLLEVIR